MTKRTVDDMYGGRHRPYGQVRDGSHRRIESEPAMESKGPALRNNRPQDIEDQHDDRSSPRGYYNDVPANSWLRSDGTQKPSFDKQGVAWRQSDGSIHGPAYRPDEFLKPQPVTANKKQMRDGG
jgi:hypothetical protein